MILFVDTREGTAPLCIDKEGMEAYIGGRACGLPRQEFALLDALSTHSGETLTRSALLKIAWGYQSEGDTRTVDMHIRRLRKKLGAPCIETVYRAGYRFLSAQKTSGRDIYQYTNPSRND